MSRTADEAVSLAMIGHRQEIDLDNVAFRE